MALLQCKKGHYYDDLRFSSCPHCGINLEGNKTVSKARSSLNTDNDKTVAKIVDNEKTVAFSNVDEDAKTVGIYNKKFSGEPVVGWLVCTEGAEKGRDYRVHPARNFIGRSASSDINIFDDVQISRENHASIVYDPHSNKFSVVAGENSSSYLNDITIENVQMLNDGDELVLGSSKFIFIAFCKGERTW